MKYEYYDKYINKKTKWRYDITPLFENPEIFANLLKDLLKPFNKWDYDKIAGLDALWFIIWWALAQKWKIWFISIRKWWKLPWINNSVLKSSQFIDYSSFWKSLEINKSSVKKWEKIIIIDEWIETWTQIKESITLIENLWGVVVWITTLCAHKNKQTEFLFNNYNLHSINIINEM